MDMENKEHNKLERAQLRVAQIRRFYRHVGVFVIINVALLLSKDQMTIAFLGEKAMDHPEAMNWIYWNIYIWAAILAVHALYVFGNVPFFIKKWEKRQIERFMKEEKERNKYE